MALVDRRGLQENDLTRWILSRVGIRYGRADGGIAPDEIDLEERFRALAADTARFSREVVDLIVPRGKDRSRLAARNIDIARTVFGKWGIEIFVILDNLGPIGFADIRRSLGGLGSRVLSRKLKKLEDQGLVQRTVVDSRPPTVRYSLTEAGEMVVRIGTPVFLFLAFREHPLLHP